MKREDDEQLWDLLGKAPQPEVSPFFARNVLRRIREQPSWLVRARSWLSLRKLVPISGFAVAIVGTFLFLHRSALDRKPVNGVDVIAQIDVQDYEVVADLDDLLASDENILWDDNSSL